MTTFASTLVELRVDSCARFRLFCFPYAGGSINAFREWPPLLPDEIALYAAQLPGRENRIGERPYTSIGPLVTELAHNIAPLLDLPCAFFGHSMGALISFELARKLRSQGKVLPRLLIVSGRKAPSWSALNDRPPMFNLPDHAFRKRLREYHGIPEDVLANEEIMMLFVPMLRADCTLNETYVYGEEAPFDFPIAAFGGLEDATVSRESLAAWAQQTASEFSIRMLPGNHFFLHSTREELLHDILQQLQCYL